MESRQTAATVGTLQPGALGMTMVTALLDVRATAAILGLSEKAVRHLIERRVLPHRRIGRRVVVLRNELERWLSDLPGIRLDELYAMEERR